MNKSLLIIIISLLVSMGIVVVVNPVYGSVYAKLYVDPPSIIDTTKTSGTNFTVNINIKDVTDLYSYDLKLMYDTTLLNVATVSIGPFCLLYTSDAADE